MRHGSVDRFNDLTLQLFNLSVSSVQLLHEQPDQS